MATTVGQHGQDRKATPREVAAARRLVLGADGMGLEEATRRLGFKSSGYVSLLLRGKVNRQLLLSELRKLRGPAPETTDEEAA